jgi:hypothetical protein
MVLKLYLYMCAYLNSAGHNMFIAMVHYGIFSYLQLARNLDCLGNTIKQE